MLIGKKGKVGDKVRVIPCLQLKRDYSSRYWKKFCECEYGVIDSIDSSGMPYCLKLYNKENVEIENYIWVFLENVEEYKTNKK